ncbi:MAG: TonB-dependent receptor, partial [Verrucomicrobia bacterium]|nr:TonB-dependent receptor [Verrucomicrobiota bacterium]
IGGAVNMVSKSALDRKGRHLSGQVGAIYRARPGFGQPPLRAYAVSYSEVFGDKFGVSLNYGNRSHYSPTPATSRAYENKLDDPAYTYRFGTEDYYHKQTRWGGGLKLDYKLSEGTRFYGNVTRNRMMEPSFNHYIDYATTDAAATRDAAGNLTGAGGIVPGYTKTVTEWRPIPASTVTANSSFEWKHVGSVHAEIGAVHKFRGLDVDYNLYKSVSTTNYPHNDQTNIIATGIGLRIEDTSDPNLPKLTQTAGPDITNPNSYSTARRDLRKAQGKDAFVGAAINIKKNFDTVVPTWVKAGVRLRTQNRDLFADQFRWNYVGRDGVTGVNQATGINDDNLAQFVNPNIRRWGGTEKYPLLPTLNWATWGWNPGGNYKPGPSLETGLRDSPALFVEDVELRTRTALANRQKFEETINAAYIMGNMDLGKLQITAGMRVEETKTEGEGAKNEITPAEAALRAAFVGPLTDAEIIRRTTAQYRGRQKAKGDYREVFPGLHFKYTVLNNLLVRASYSSNIGRPSIGQLIPNTTVDNIRRSLVISNPSLKPQHANNFDLGVEYYFEPVGVLSAGVFLKEIKQFIFTRGGDVIQGNTGEYGEYTGYTFSSQFNGGAARVRGSNWPTSNNSPSCRACGRVSVCMPITRGIRPRAIMAGPCPRPRWPGLFRKPPTPVFPISGFPSPFASSTTTLAAVSSASPPPRRGSTTGGPPASPISRPSMRLTRTSPFISTPGISSTCRSCPRNSRAGAGAGISALVPRSWVASTGVIRHLLLEAHRFRRHLL